MKASEKGTVLIKCVINIYEFMKVGWFIKGMVKWVATSDGLAHRASVTGLESELLAVVGRLLGKWRKWRLEDVFEQRGCERTEQ